MAETNTKEKHIALEAMKDAQKYIEGKKEEFVATMKNDLGKKISDCIKERNLSVSDINNVLISAIVLVTGEPAEKVISKLIETQKKLKAQNIDNIILLTTFYNLDTKYLFGDNKDINDKKFPRRLDKVTKIVEVSESGSKKDGGDSSTTTQEVGFGLDWNNVNSWDWPNFIEALNINFTGDQRIKKLKAELSMFPKLCYTYIAIEAAGGSSSYDSLVSGLAFPFFEEQLPRITYTSPFGPRTGGASSFHYGIDLAADIGEEIHCAADGCVSYAWPDDGDFGGNRLCVQHADNIYTVYMHMNDQINQVGQNLTKGQVIGHVGNTGGSTGPHLHFEVHEGGPESKAYAVDPVKYYSRLGSCPDDATLDSVKD